MGPRPWATTAPLSDRRTNSQAFPLHDCGLPLALLCVPFKRWSELKKPRNCGRKTPVWGGFGTTTIA